MNTLKERLEAALEARNGATKAGLARACDISKPAVTAWFNGSTTKLDGSNLLAAARYLGVRPEWLANGRGRMRIEQGAENTEEGPAIRGQVPEISWVQAGNPSEAVDNFHPGDGERSIPVTVAVRRHTFALRVKGDSMVDPSGIGPSFPEGITIIVEPDEEPRHRRFVVVKSDDETEATFKQLIIDGQDWYLRPLNPTYKTKPFPADGRICGVVVQAVWTFD